MNIHITEYERTRDAVLEVINELDAKENDNLLVENSCNEIRKIFKLRDLMIEQEEKKQAEHYKNIEPPILISGLGDMRGYGPKK